MGVKRKTLTQLQNKLWQLCRKIIHNTYVNTCYTCDEENLSGHNYHVGHLWPKSTLNAYLKYDLRVLRPQCCGCNTFHEGRGADFLAKMLQEEGATYVNLLYADRQLDAKVTHGSIRLFYEAKIAEYQTKLDEINA